jgi:hypothetical protein
VAIDSSAFSSYTSGGVIYNVSQTTLDVLNTFPESTYQSSPDTKLVNRKLWKRVQFHDISQLFQFQITYSDTQMRCEPIVSEDVVLHGLIFWFSEGGRIIDV